MSETNRSARLLRGAAVGAVVLALVAWRGVGIDASRIAGVVPAEIGITVRTHEARLALRPLPVMVARHATLTLAGGGAAELASIRIGVSTRGLLRGRLEWRRARIRDAALVMPMDDGQELRCEGIDGRARVVGARGARLALDASCAWGRVTASALRYEGVVRSQAAQAAQTARTARTARPVRSDGWLRAGPVTTAGLAADAIEARLRTGADGLRATELRITAGDGRLDGWARVHAGAQGPRRAFTLEGLGEAAERIFAATRMRAHGRWVARARWRATPTTGRQPDRGAGHGRLLLLDGRIEPLAVGPALLDGLEVWRGRRRRQLRRRFPDVFQGPGLRFDRATARVRVQHGRVVVAPVRVRSESYRAVGQGRLRRDGTIRGRLEITPSAPLADALVGRGALRAILAGGADADLVIPLELTGRPGRVRVRPARSFARDVIERALGGSSLGDALDRLVDR